jgi:protein-tyrosine-phosphatase
VIFVIDIRQLVQLRKRFAEAGARTFLLTCLAPSTPLQIDDPVVGDESAFEACFNQISSAADPIVRALSESTTSP